MKLGIASAIFCTALLVSSSLCNVIPSPDYWERQLLLDEVESQQLTENTMHMQQQQEHQVGSDVEAVIISNALGNYKLS
jgi:hypothetical protein